MSPPPPPPPWSRSRIISKPKIENAHASSSSPSSPAAKKPVVSPDVFLKKDSKFRRRRSSLFPPKSPQLMSPQNTNNKDPLDRPRGPPRLVVDEKDSLIKELHSQVLSLQSDLHKAHTLNKELDSLNKKLSHHLALHLAPPFNLPSPQSNEQVHSSLTFNNTAIKLDDPPPPPAAHRTDPVTQSSPSLPPSPSPPPPPPPPPPMRPVARAVVSAPKTPAIVEFYRSLRKQQEDNRHLQGPTNHYKPTSSSSSSSVHNSIVGEIQNRSAHLLAIKADIETKGDFINGLIQKVVAFPYTDIEDVLKFVNWLDGELSTLADERAVLKHFNWPERKADAIREAAIEYRGLKQLEREVTSFKDDTSIPCGTALKKMALLLDKSERGIGRLIKLRSSAFRTYQDWKIPTNWMLDSGIVSKIKEGSMKLAKMYIKRVKKELEVGRSSDRECSQEALVLQGVQFAYRAHQFAGGLDSETLCAFEEIRQHVPQHQIGVGVASRELLAAVPSS